MLRIPRGESKLRLSLQALVVCAGLQAAALPAAAIGLAPTAAVQSIAYDGIANRLYFLEITGALKSLELTPECEAGLPPACKVSPVATFVQPLDVVVNSPAGLAYVTTFDGTLWKVDLNSKAPVAVRVAIGLGIPSDVVLAPEMNSAYVLERRGKLWRVDLSSGQKTVLSTLGFVSQALVVNAARTIAYVLQGPPHVFVEVDLGTGKKKRTLGSFGQLSEGPYSLAWTDSAENALYFLVGEINSSALLRVDLVAVTASVMAKFPGGPLGGDGSIPANPGGLAVNPSGSGLYLGGTKSVLRFPLSAAPDPREQRVFLRVGNIPAASISPSDGYANTAAASTSFKVVDAPFGGTLDLFGDLTLLWSKSATKYKISIVFRNRLPVSPPAPILASWTASHWNPNSKPPRYEPTVVAPDSGGFYAISPDYASPLRVPFWSPTYLMMRWPTSDNGLYTLQIQIFDSAGKDITSKIPVAQQSLTLRIDNTPPVADLNSIRVLDTATTPRTIDPCEIVLPPAPNAFDFGLNAFDGDGHLLSYSLTARWGRNQSATVLSDSYGSNVDRDGPHLWKGLNGFRPLASGWKASCNCAHSFVLQVSKRTTNGYGYILSSSSAQSITIANAGSSCP